MRQETVAGWLSIAAGAVHAGAAPEHFDVWWGYGAFFAATSLAQALLGLVLVTRGIDTATWPWTRTRVPVCIAGILGNLAVLGLWVVTRTVGIPSLGPEAGIVEPVGSADAIAAVLEVATIILLAVVLRNASRDRTDSAPSTSNGPSDR